MALFEGKELQLRRNMGISILLFAAIACSPDLQTPDVTDLTTSAYRMMPVAAVSIDPAAATVAVGASKQLTVKTVNSEGHRIVGLSGAAVRWVSSDTTIAKVSASGIVVGIQSGKAVITAVASGHTGTANLTIATGNEQPASAPTETNQETSTTSTAPVAEPAPQPTAPVQPPSQPVAANGSGVSANPLIFDDFRNYRSTSDLQLMISKNIGGLGAPNTSVYVDGHNPDLAQIDNTVLYNGHASLKYNQPANTSSTPQLWVDFPKPLTRFWFRAKIRYSPGFTTDGVTPNYGKGYKLFGWGWQGTDGRGSLEYGNINDYYSCWYVRGPVTGTAPDKMAGKAGSEWTDGNWYEYVVLYEQTSPTTVRQRWWLARDGQPLVLRGDQQGGMDNGATVPAANRFMLGMNFNQTRGPNQNQALWYGQWEVVDGVQNYNPFNIPGV